MGLPQLLQWASLANHVVFWCRSLKQNEWLLSRPLCEFYGRLWKGVDVIYFAAV